ncbi:MAG: hypothetical protein ARM1_0716 [Candidatus Micrarchaeota archaeon]|nr:MAG: hypothetical protein ARM1_0716 [Candidatus Micrarchaeota archaeon]
MNELIFIYAYKFNRDVSDLDIAGLLKKQEDVSLYTYNKPEPEEITTIKLPEVFNLKEEDLQLDSNIRVKIRSQVAVYKEIGVSIRVRVSSDSYNLFDQISFNSGFYNAIAKLVSRAKTKITNLLRQYYSDIDFEPSHEEYRFYYIDSNPSSFIAENSSRIAGWLIDEKDYNMLNKAYIKQVLSKNLIYDNNTSLYVGWESAVLISSGYQHEFELIVAEVANLHLLNARLAQSRLNDYFISYNNKMLRTEPSDYNSKNKAVFLRERHKLLDLLDDTSYVISIIEQSAYALGEWYISRVYALFYSTFKIDIFISNLKDYIDRINDLIDNINTWIISYHSYMQELIIIVFLFLELVIEILLALKYVII